VLNIGMGRRMSDDNKVHYQPACQECEKAIKRIKELEKQIKDILQMRVRVYKDSEGIVLAWEQGSDTTPSD